MQSDQAPHCTAGVAPRVAVCVHGMIMFLTGKMVLTARPCMATTVRTRST